MASEDNRLYFLNRAKVEQQIATCCENNSIALIHFQFADEYERGAMEYTISSRYDGVDKHNIIPEYRLR